MKIVKPIVFLLLISLSACGHIRHELRMKEMHDEQWQAVDFVKGSKDVIREVGTIKNVTPLSSRTEHGEIYPSRYALSVVGEKSTTAVVNVSRSFGSVEFTLACLGYFPPPQDAHTDRYACNK
jgi:hypothetical protein